MRADENCRLCPESARIIESIPEILTAFFSILQPHTHIKPHRGPFGGILRHHLGMIVPEPRADCRIRVDRQTTIWEEGRSLVFDDTYEHEVWNDTNGQRVVLFVDFERPMGPFLRGLNRGMIRLIARSALVQDAIRRYEDWTRNEAARRNADARAGIRGNGHETGRAETDRDGTGGLGPDRRRVGIESERPGTSRRQPPSGA